MLLLYKWVNCINLPHIIRLDQIQRPISADILLFRSNGRENVEKREFIHWWISSGEQVVSSQVDSFALELYR